MTHNRMHIDDLPVGMYVTFWGRDAEPGQRLGINFFYLQKMHPITKVCLGSKPGVGPKLCGWVSSKNTGYLDMEWRHWWAADREQAGKGSQTSWMY